MKRATKPADGERRAMSGFVPQYKIAANFVYTALSEGTFEWIRVTDPEAGQMDDILIASNECINAYQVKWSEFTGTTSFNDFANVSNKKDSKESKQCFVKQLAYGWKLLKQKYPDHQVSVHLISKHIPSPNAKIPLDDPPPISPNFQAFLRDCWEDKSWSEKGFAALPECWQSAMMIAMKASGLTEEEFISFFNSCNLHFQYNLAQKKAFSSRDETKKEKDVDEIYNLLTTIAGGEKRVIEISIKDILRRLNWEVRFKFKFKHDFWVDEKLYQPIEGTVEEIESSLSKFTKGYLALIGPPGSGKSTTLTQTLRYKKGFRIIRYYAFVRDDTLQGRGEAKNFLHDFVLALRKHGFCGQSRSFPVTGEDLKEQLSSQLSELKERYKKDGIKTLILIDGLDHIEREQSPERTLLKDIPNPEEVPEGVLFLLGSQKIDLAGLSSRIQVHLSEAQRTLTMHSLSRKAVYNILDSASLKVSLASDQKERTMKLSDGHPLALYYMREKIQTANSNKDIDEILNACNSYQGNIEQDYELYWKKFAADQEVYDLLALISRLRTSIYLDEVVDWLGEPVVKRFMEQAHHYFKKNSKEHWQFFHNSFRQFILNKTGRNLFDKEDRKKHQNYHRKLAKFSGSAKQGTPLSWERIYHIASSGDQKSVLKIGNQEYFRKHFFEMRPIEGILDDITLIMKAAQKEKDGLAVVRAICIETELRERDENIGAVDIPRLLLEIEGVAASVEYVLRDKELMVYEKAALKFCKVLIEKGALSEASKIFNAAEPLEILSGAKGIDLADRENFNLVKAWASVSHYFRSLDQIFHAIDQLIAASSPYGYEINIEKSSLHIRHKILNVLCVSIVESSDKQKFKKLKENLKKRDKWSDLLISIDFNICTAKKDKKETNEALSRILKWASQNDISDADKTLIAEYLLRINNDKIKAATWIDGIEQPPIYKEKSSYERWKNLKPFVQRIRLNRLLSALGKEEDPLEIIPNSDDERQKGSILFERLLVLISNLWGKAWKGVPLSPGLILLEIHPALLLFNRDWKETRDWDSWHKFKGEAPEYFKFLIKAVSVHGPEALAALSKEFDKFWSAKSKRGFWHTSLKRTIAVELYREGNSLNDFLKRLEGIEKEIKDEEETRERVNEYAHQAFAWIEAGKPDRARSLMTKMFKTSFGIKYDKDDQYHRWVQWLARINSQKKEGIEERIRRFASTLVEISIKSRGSHTQEAAKDLIEAVTLWNPGHALNLRSWLLKQNAVDFIETLEGLISGALKIPDPPLEIITCILCHLLIPFRYPASKTITKLFALKCYQFRKDKEAKKLVEIIMHAVFTKGFPTDTRDWLTGFIEGIKESGNDAEWIENKLPDNQKPDNKQTTERTIELLSGEKLNEEGAILKTRSYNDLINLIKNTSKAEFFRWEKLVSGVIANLSLQQVNTLNKELEKFKPGLTINTILAKRLMELDAPEQAKSMIKPVWAKSSSSGWIRMYDGGTRLNAANCLIEIEGEDGRNKAFEIFINDYLSNSRFPSEFLRTLDEFFPVLFRETPLDEVWNEVEEHIYQLHDFANAEHTLPPKFDESLKATHEQALIKLLFITHSIPVPELIEETHRALCDLILTKVADKYIYEGIKSLINEGAYGQVHALAMLESVSNIRLEFCEKFKGEIKKLTTSNSMAVRQMTKRLSDKFNITTPPVKKEKTELPITYQMKLPEIPLPEERISHTSLPEDEPFPDSEDPLEMIQPFQYNFEILAKMSGIPLQNLVARAANLMKSLAPQEEWNKESEKKLRIWLNSANLKLTFNRPRPRQAFLAYSHIIAELVDCKIISDSNLHYLLKSLVLYDPSLSLKEASIRPDDIKEPVGINERMGVGEEWINYCKDDFSTFLHQLSDGRIVIGELSRFTNMNWDKPEALKFSMVCHPDWSVSREMEEANDFFPHNYKWHGKDYPNLYGAEKKISLIVYANPRTIEIGKGEWLALNPAIATHAEWKQSSEGLFSWIDSKGNKMVESIFWRQGPIRRVTYHSNNVCSEGWLVVATQKAAEKLLNIATPAIRFEAAIRKINDRDEKSIKTSFALNRKNFTIVKRNKKNQR